MADVLQSPEHTRRVLREVCILRRLRHPNLIAIRDAFVRPSATGQCRLRGGKLVNLSVDVYIAMELADGGDLFHLRGQLTGAPWDALASTACGPELRQCLCDWLADLCSLSSAVQAPARPRAQLLPVAGLPSLGRRACPALQSSLDRPHRCAPVLPFLPGCSGGEVRSLMWQLIVTIRYLHSLHVWHRDMKSQVGSCCSRGCSCCSLLVSMPPRLARRCAGSGSSLSLCGAPQLLPA